MQSTRDGISKYRNSSFKDDNNLANNSMEDIMYHPFWGTNKGISLLAGTVTLIIARDAGQSMDE